MKTKLLLALAAVLVSCSILQAQHEQPATVAGRLLKINFLTPGIEYEQSISESTTLNLNPNVGFGLGYSSVTGLNTSIFPSLDIQARKYYNLSKRIEKGKNVAYNSGNFVALSAFGSTASIIENDNIVNEASYGIGPVWGMQRNYKGGFNLTLTLGAGYGKNNLGHKGFAPLLGLNLGFLVGRGR